MPHQVGQSPSCWGCRARRTDRLTLDLAELSTQLSFTRPGQLSRRLPRGATGAQAHNARCQGGGRPGCRRAVALIIGVVGYSHQDLAV